MLQRYLRPYAGTLERAHAEIKKTTVKSARQHQSLPIPRSGRCAVVLANGGSAAHHARNRKSKPGDFQPEACSTRLTLTADTAGSVEGPDPTILPARPATRRNARP